MNIAYGGSWGGSSGTDDECLPQQMQVGGYCACISKRRYKRFGRKRKIGGANGKQ